MSHGRGTAGKTPSSTIAVQHFGTLPTGDPGRSNALDQAGRRVIHPPFALRSPPKRGMIQAYPDCQVGCAKDPVWAGADCDGRLWSR